MENSPQTMPGFTKYQAEQFLARLVDPKASYNDDTGQIDHRIVHSWLNELPGDNRWSVLSNWVFYNFVDNSVRPTSRTMGTVEYVGSNRDWNPDENSVGDAFQYRTITHQWFTDYD